MKMLSQALPHFLLTVALPGKEGGYFPPSVGGWGGRAPHGRKLTLSRCIDMAGGGGWAVTSVCLWKSYVTSWSTSSFTVKNDKNAFIYIYLYLCVYKALA